MGLLSQINHLLNFLLPAVGLAGIFMLAGLWHRRKKVHILLHCLQFGINLGVGSAVLAFGLLGFGVDGKMVTYAALVLAMATSQWAMDELTGRG
ncbi:MAG: hypothetical protein RLZZ126_1527 [Pseudomonadota bacterium]|jgi:hypothetical protein